MMEELPNELLLQIFGLLHTSITCFFAPRTPTPSRDLLALCCVCQRFKDVARSLIYESIERAGDMNSQAFRQLPRTLLKNLELCRYIKNLRLKMEDGFEVGDFWAGHYMLPADEHEDEEDEEPAIEDTSCIRYQRRHRRKMPGDNENDIDEDVNEMPKSTPEGYEWLGKLVSAMESSQAHANDHDLLERAILGEDVLLTPCILSACNLERLWIRLPKMQVDGKNTCFLFNSIAHSALEGGFQLLKLLHLDVHQSGLEWPVRNALPLFLFPNLIDLTLGNCGQTDLGHRFAIGPDTDDSTFMGDAWIWPVRTSPITRLSLLSPRFSSSIAAKMILACRAITKFELVLPHQRPPHNNEFYEDIGVALVEHAGTLLSLSLGDQLAAFGCVLAGSPGLFRAGTRLSSLTSLRANPYTLFGLSHRFWYPLASGSTFSDALPNTIEHLWLDLPLGQWNTHLGPYFAGLFDDRRNGRFPRLKRVYIHWHEMFEYDYEKIFCCLRSLMEIRQDAIGIAFEITVRVAYDTPVSADIGLMEFMNCKRRWPSLPPLEHCCRSDDGRRYYVEGSTCEVPRKRTEEIQDDLDHGYWRTSYALGPE